MVFIVQVAYNSMVEDAARFKSAELLEYTPTMSSWGRHSTSLVQRAVVFLI